MKLMTKQQQKNKSGCKTLLLDLLLWCEWAHSFKKIRLWFFSVSIYFIRLTVPSLRTCFLPQKVVMIKDYYYHYACILLKLLLFLLFFEDGDKQLLLLCIRRNDGDDCDNDCNDNDQIAWLCTYSTLQN